MRTLTRLATLALCFTLASCGSDSPSDSNGGGNSMSATIDGASWSANLAVQGNYASNVLAIGGTLSSGALNTKQINLTLTGLTAPGTYQLGLGQLNIATVVFLVGTQAQTWSSTLVGGAGSVVVTELDEDGAKGTFTITAPASPNTGATGTKAITNGSFDVKF